MKKSILIAMCLSAAALNAQTERSLAFGLQWGLHGNHSAFSGGMEEAHARFHHNDFGAVALEVVARYDHDNHWMATTGIGLSTFGFEFAVSENYRLRTEQNRFSTVRNEFGAISLPFMVYYKFNPDCKQKRWLLGAGFSSSAVGKQASSKYVDPQNEGNTNLNYLSSSAEAPGGLTSMLRFSIAREKTFKCGSIFQVAALLNIGFREIAKAQVNYTLDGKSYQHEFTNNGSFAGIRFSFYCGYFRKNYSGQNSH